MKRLERPLSLQGITQLSPVHPRDFGTVISKREVIAARNLKDWVTIFLFMSKFGVALLESCQGESEFDSRRPSTRCPKVGVVVGVKGKQTRQPFKTIHLYSI